jgi:hypothetical protein
MKKWLVGVLIVGFVGVLIAGAVIRTMDKTEQSSSAYGEGHDRAADGLSGRGNGAGEPLDRLQENEKRYAQSLDSQQGNGRQYGQSLDRRTGGSETSGGAIGVSQAEVGEWVTLEGVVAGIQEEALIVELSGGGELIVEGRAWSFAQELGFGTQIGNQVSLAGFYEGDDFEVGRIVDQSADYEVVLREIGGRPLWAGNGRRGAQG